MSSLKIVTYSLKVEDSRFKAEISTLIACAYLTTKRICYK